MRLIASLLSLLLLCQPVLAQEVTPAPGVPISYLPIIIPPAVCNWNGTTGTDATAVIQAAINAAVAANGEVDLPSTPCKITSALTASGNFTLRGQGCFELWGSNPTSYIYPAGGIKGSTIVQTTAATDILDLKGTGATVNLYDFCGSFGAPYVNTGNGIAVIPPAYAGYLDHGQIGGHWRDVKILGVDGNHYSFFLQNTLLSQMDNLKSYGGGCMSLYNNSVNYQYGNLTVAELYCSLYIGGSSHGIVCDATATPALTVGNTVFDHPQVELINLAGSGFVQPPGTAAPTNAQAFFTTGTNGLCDYLTEIFPDFESNISGAYYQFPIHNNTLSGGFIYGSSNNTTLTKNPSSATPYQNLTGSALFYQLNMQFLNTGAPTITVFTGATSGTLALDSYTQAVAPAASGTTFVNIPITIPAGWWFQVTFSNASVDAAGTTWRRIPGF